MQMDNQGEPAPIHLCVHLALYPYPLPLTPSPYVARYARECQSLAPLANARRVLVGEGYGARAVNCSRSALRPYALPVGPRLSITVAIMGGHNADYGARAECF